MIFIIFLLLSLSFLIFSYLWIDFAVVLTIAQGHPKFQKLLSIIEFTRENRELLSQVYLILIVCFFVFDLFLLFFPKILLTIRKKRLFFITAVFVLVFSFSYPFLSYDIFTYLFSAKMLLHYHVNPYKVAPEEFLGRDLWLDFLRNVQFKYAYGPVYLFYSLIPGIIFSTRRLILNFYFLKLMNALVFWFTGYLLFELRKEDYRVFSWWFFNPFLLIELLVNSHSDLLMIWFFILGVFYLNKKKVLNSIITMGLSVLTKYVSIIGVPLLFLGKRLRNIYLKFLAISLFCFLLFQKQRVTQPWYFSWSYMYLPFIELRSASWALINLNLLLLLINSYYPFLKTGGWSGTTSLPELKILSMLFLVFIMILESNLFKKLIKRGKINVFNLVGKIQQ